MITPEVLLNGQHGPPVAGALLVDDRRRRAEFAAARHTPRYICPATGEQTRYDRDTKQWVTSPWYGASVCAQTPRHPITAAIHDALTALGETAVPGPAAAGVLDALAWCTVHLGLPRRPRLAWFKANGRSLGMFLDREYCVALADNLTADDALGTVAHEAYHAYQYSNNLPEWWHTEQREAAAEDYARRVMKAQAMHGRLPAVMGR